MATNYLLILHTEFKIALLPNIIELFKGVVTEIQLSYMERVTNLASMYGR